MTSEPASPTCALPTMTYEQLQDWAPRVFPVSLTVDMFPGGLASREDMIARVADVLGPESLDATADQHGVSYYTPHAVPSWVWTDHASTPRIKIFYLTDEETAMALVLLLGRGEITVHSDGVAQGEGPGR